MKTTITVTLEIKGTSHTLTLDEARQLHAELGRLFSVPALQYPPGVRSPEWNKRFDPYDYNPSFKVTCGPGEVKL